MLSGVAASDGGLGGWAMSGEQPALCLISNESCLVLRARDECDGVLAGLCEAGGGALLLLGLATPFACLLLAVTMINAIGAVTFKRQFLLGSELELTYLVIAIALAATGPGRLSLDRAIGWDDNISGLWWGVPVAFAAALISLVTLTLFREKPAPEAAAAV